MSATETELLKQQFLEFNYKEFIPFHLSKKNSTNSLVCGVREIEPATGAPIKDRNLEEVIFTI